MTLIKVATNTVCSKDALPIRNKIKEGKGSKVS